MKRERGFFIESVQKIIGLLPFSSAPTLNGLLTDTHKQAEEKREKTNTFQTLYMKENKKEVKGKKRKM